MVGGVLALGGVVALGRVPVMAGGVLALVLAARSTGLDTSMKIVLAFLAFVAIAGNWLRWYRSR